MDDVYSADRGGGGVSDLKIGFKYPAGVASKDGACAGAHFRLLHGICFVEGAGTVAIAGEVGKFAAEDAGRVGADSEWGCDITNHVGRSFAFALCCPARKIATGDSTAHGN